MASPWGTHKKGIRTGGQKGGRQRSQEFTGVPKTELPKASGCSFAKRLEERLEGFYADLRTFGLAACEPEKACNRDCEVYVEVLRQMKVWKGGK